MYQQPVLLQGITPSPTQISKRLSGSCYIFTLNANLNASFFFGGGVKCYISWIMSHSSIRQSGKREIRKSSRWRSANSAAAASDFSMAWDRFFWPVKKMVVSCSFLVPPGHMMAILSSWVCHRFFPGRNFTIYNTRFYEIIVFWLMSGWQFC